MFLWNLLLALIWASVTERFTIGNFIVGFWLGYLVLSITDRAFGPSNYFMKVLQVTRFVLFFIWELILANLRVAYDVLTPQHYMRPGVIAIPLDAKTDEEINLLANLITLTPGTLSLDVSVDRRVLYIHAMYIDDVETLKKEIKDGFEERVLEVLR
jgi:multicomponent Na+:H+ antiporter subunit E